MQELENWALKKLNFHISFFFRYVDDILIYISSSETNKILQLFNSYHPRLQFTIEKGGNKINFLDVTLIMEGFLKIDWFQKLIFLGDFSISTLSIRYLRKKAQF